MRAADANYIEPMSIIKLGVLLPLLLCYNVNIVQGLFEAGKEYVYSYTATSDSGVLLPSQASSAWEFHGKLVIQAKENASIMQGLRMRIWNGKDPEDGNDFDIRDNATELLKPFQVSYNNGLAENFSSEAAEVWSLNIKRSIAGIMQLDLLNLQKHAAFQSVERNHYGQCNIEYVVNHDGDNEKEILKFFDPRTCQGYRFYTWSNVPKLLCPNRDQNPVLKSSARMYRVRMRDSMPEILFVNASGGVYVQPFQSLGEAQFHFTKQIIKLVSVNEIQVEISTKDMTMKSQQHELPEGDLTQGRSKLDKHFILKTVGNLLDRLSQRLENPGLDTDSSKLHNSTISVLLYYLGMLDVADLRAAYTKISGTSYKEETIGNMFLEALPQIGTKEAALFIQELIQDQKVSDISAIELLTQLPFHIRKPDVPLLVNLQTLLNLPEKISSEIQNTAILSYGTLIYKTCLVYCPYEMLDDYVRLYLDKFTETNDYEKKMIWLEGLSNIQLGRVVEFLEPIASGANAESHHFRVLAAWASLPTAPLRPNVIYPVYWPILANRTEHLEMRVAALTLLILSSPPTNRLISLYWYMQSESNEHLHHYFYTTLKSMERTTHPCYAHLGVIAAQFARVLRARPNNQHLLTGNYLFDYQDSYRKFGAMVQGIVIANPITNVPEVFYTTFSSYGSGTTINHVSLYIKAEGLLNSLSTYFDSVTPVKDILNRFKFQEKPNPSAHLEIIARIQDKTVLCLHLNETNVVKGMKYLSSFPENIYHIYKNMEFHVNQQRINVPLVMEAVQVTDLGTNIRLAFTTTSLFSMRGNFTYTINGRNNHVLLRTSIHGVETIESYNPLVDTWHGAERAQSVHGYLPVNITIGLDDRPFIMYNTPEEHMKIGIMGHVRTSTNIKGANINSRLAEICPNCSTLYVVTKSPGNIIQKLNLFEADLAELGGQVCVNVFDCENVISRENLVTDILSSHRTNNEIGLAMLFPLLGLHFLDYFVYVPPRGSCGLAAYISTVSDRRTEVKLEYVKTKAHHVLSLTHRDSETLNMLHQWNLAAVYETPNWSLDVLKVKTTKIVPGQKVLKLCLEAERQMPWESELLSMRPAEPSRVAVNLAWGFSDTAKGRCTGSSMIINLIGSISEEQISESKESKWPYSKCRADSKGKHFVPFTDACYEASKELSTLRKYQAIIAYENLPDSFTAVARKLRALYDLIGGNSYLYSMSENFVLNVKFPKDSNTGELSLNRDKIPIGYHSNFVDYFLVQSRVHKYIDKSLFKSLFGTCVISMDFVRSIRNVTYALEDEREILLLGQCNNNNPRYVLTARRELAGIHMSLHDESDMIHITPYQYGGAIYNASTPLAISPNFEFHTVGSKRIRMDSKSIDLILPSIHLFMHWTQRQTVLFFPKYVLEFSCGMCTLETSHKDHLYEEL